MTAVKSYLYTVLQATVLMVAGVGSVAWVTATIAAGVTLFP